MKIEIKEDGRLREKRWRKKKKKDDLNLWIPVISILE